MDGKTEGGGKKDRREGEREGSRQVDGNQTCGKINGKKGRRTTDGGWMDG